MTSRDGEPSGWALEQSRKFRAGGWNLDITDVKKLAKLFDAAHAAGRLEERERAARVCEARRDYWRRVYEGEVVHGTYPRGGDHCQEVGARGTEADACVALIRKEPNE